MISHASSRVPHSTEKRPRLPRVTLHGDSEAETKNITDTDISDDYLNFPQYTKMRQSLWHRNELVESRTSKPDLNFVFDEKEQTPKKLTGYAYIKDALKKIMSADKDELHAMAREQSPVLPIKQIVETSKRDQV